MAVKLESTIKRWIGLSTDSKPPEVGQDKGTVPVGSSFLETDTGRIFRWDGSAWTCAADDSATQDLLSMILLVLRDIRERIYLTTE